MFSEFLGKIRHTPDKWLILLTLLSVLMAVAWGYVVVFFSGAMYLALGANTLLVLALSTALSRRVAALTRQKEASRTEILAQKQLLNKGLNQLSTLKAKSVEIEKELSLAREIQLAMIPPRSKYSSIGSIYLPMGKIGGDFFDIIPLNERQQGIFICDVTGHGVPAALITMMIKSMILVGISELPNDPAASWLTDPRRFIVHMNNALLGHLRENFTTAFYGIYDKVDKTLRYSSAAHPPPILLRYGADSPDVDLGFLNVSPQSPPFGVHLFGDEKPAIGVNQITLPENSRLLFYSDGLMDNVGYDFLNFEAGMDSFEGTVLYDFFRESKSFNLQGFMESLSILLLMHKDLGLEDDVCVVALENDLKTG